MEFDAKNKKEKAVIESWKAYLDHLGDKSFPPDQWGVKRIDLFVELLHKIAQVLDYDFDKTHIKNSSYSPTAHGTIEEQQHAMRQGLVELLEGKRVIPMFVTNMPVSDTEQRSLPDESGS